jgi:hypothetical protein
LTDTYNGLLSIAESDTDEYTITIRGGPWKATQCIIVQTDERTLTADTSGTDPSAGTVQIQFSGAFDSGHCEVFMLVNDATR